MYLVSFLDCSPQGEKDVERCTLRPADAPAAVMQLRLGRCHWPYFWRAC